MGTGIVPAIWREANITAIFKIRGTAGKQETDIGVVEKLWNRL